MTSLQDALNERAISKVAIVDDCIDEIPLANDLTDVDAAWANFHDDWNDEIEAAVRTEYSGDLAEPFDLRQEDAYIGALWKKRTDLGDGIKPVFEGYESKQRYDLKAIDQLETHLTDLGLAVERHGRDFVDAAKQADLIVIDLFLGAAQDADASRLSKERLSEIVADKQAEMPPVLLFSNSTRLSENRESYRDEANLLESGFRILRKDELETPAPLYRQLERLAKKRDETRLLASFFIALERSLVEASHSNINDDARPGSFRDDSNPTTAS